MMNKKILTDHKQVGKKFFPIAARSGWTEIHYTDCILPEIAWMAYFLKSLGSKKGIEVVGLFIESCYFLKDWGKKPEFSLLSVYRILSVADWIKFRNKLAAEGILSDCQKALAPFFHCYPEGNPFSNLVDKSPNLDFSKADIDLTREVVSSLFDRRSKEASLVQSVALWIWTKSLSHWRSFAMAASGSLKSPFVSKAKMPMSGRFFFKASMIGTTALAVLPEPVRPSISQPRQKSSSFQRTPPSSST